MTTIGMNLGGLTYYSTEDAFLDKQKMASGWIGPVGGTAPTVDANGYPTGIPTGDAFIAEILPNNQYNGATNTYDLTYTGTGTVTVSGGTQIISSTPGHLVFSASSNIYYLQITADSTSDPIHDIHVVQQDQLSLFQNGEMFTPEFLAKTSQWGAIRVMDWNDTNYSTVANWSDRPTLSTASWQTTGANGVPLEAEVRLANEAHTNLWLTIPTEATDDYVRQAMQYVKDNLDPSLKVQVEYSNEVWNWGFSQASYAQSMANSLWGANASSHPTLLNGDGTVWCGNEVYYGYRSAQIAAIAHSVFGSDASTRLEDILAGQTGYSAGSGAPAVYGVGLANVGTVSNLFYAYADTSYFGYLTGNAQDQATVYGWATSGQAGIDAAIHELEYGGALSYNGSLAATVRYWQSDEAFAQANGLKLVAYEGGAALEYYDYPQSEQATILAFFQQVENDPRMGQLYTEMVNDYTAAGGSQDNVFTDTGGAGPYGYWGLLDNIYQDSSPRYDAVVALATADSTQTQVSPNLTGSTLYGTSGNDNVVGSAGNDSIVGLSGTVDALGHYIENDFYSGGGGADTILGGIGNDHIYGNAVTTVAGAVDGADSLFGGAGNDYIQGNAGNDTIDGGIGNDRLYGGADNDSIQGGAGNDYLQGNKGADTLDGGADNDTIHGGADNDSIIGGNGNDLLVGDAGNDTIVAGTGHDTLTGGTGADVFVLHAGDATFSLSGLGTFLGDEITDWAHGVDKLSLGFTVGSLLENAGDGHANPFTTVAAAEAYAQQLLTAHTGAGEVAAVAVGADTYLFYNSAGTDGAAIDAAVKLDGISLANVTTADFV